MQSTKTFSRTAVLDLQYTRFSRIQRETNPRSRSASRRAWLSQSSTSSSTRVGSVAVTVRPNRTV
jgi:hypothetical protein